MEEVESSNLSRSTTTFQRPRDERRLRQRSQPCVSFSNDVVLARDSGHARATGVSWRQRWSSPDRCGGGRLRRRLRSARSDRFFHRLLARASAASTLISLNVSRIGSGTYTGAARSTAAPRFTCRARAQRGFWRCEGRIRAILGRNPEPRRSSPSPSRFVRPATSELAASYPIPDFRNAGSPGIL